MLALTKPATMRIDCSRFTRRPFALGDPPDLAAAINSPYIVELMRSLPFSQSLFDACADTWAPTSPSD